ncbi:MAG: endonuclease domain-containing protein [Phenylobacterium sp.]|nr:MAG: endonuclease domain-containing protein [Phenylobacterium sp.]
MRPAIQRARELRRNMSEPEIMLWSRLKRLRERGWRFRRQAPFRGYFLDFVCLSRRLLVEVDGSQHADEVQSEHDFVRDRVLERQGFRVLRVFAGEVRRDLGRVMDQIVLALEAQPSTSEGGRSAGAEPGHDSPTLAASRPVPPH